MSVVLSLSHFCSHRKKKVRQNGGEKNIFMSLLHSLGGSAGRVAGVGAGLVVG